MNFFRDLWIFTKLDFKRYYAWKERLLFDVLLSIIGFLSFALVWSAVFNRGFQGIGLLRPDNFVAFILSGSIVWEFISVNLTGDGIWAFVNEKYSGTLPYLLVSPASRLAFVYSKVILNLFKILIDIIITLLLAYIFFEVELKGSIILVLLSLLIIFISFSGLGLIISILGAWREGVGSISFVIGSILYLISGVYYPIDIFPQSLQNIFSLLPTTQSLNLIREIVINNANFLNIIPILLYLIVFGFIFIILSLIVFRWFQQKISLIGI